MTKQDQIKKWAKALTEKQMRPLLVELVDFALNAEEVSFPELAPYWSATGDPLIEGQATFTEDQ